MSEARLQAFIGPVSHVVNAEKVTIKADCSGCPHLAKSQQGVPQSLKDEAEFRKLAGFTTGAIERRLLGELVEQYNLRWRGPLSVSQMWKSRTLQYNSDTGRVLPTPSLISYLWGWFVAIAIAIASSMAVALIFSLNKPDNETRIQLFVCVCLMLLYLFFSISTGLAPEVAARQLRKKMQC